MGEQREKCGEGQSAEYEGILGKFRVRGSDIIGTISAIALAVGLTMVYAQGKTHNELDAKDSAQIIRLLEKLLDQQGQANRYACQQACLLRLPQDARGQNQCDAICGAGVLTPGYPQSVPGVAVPR